MPRTPLLARSLKLLACVVALAALPVATLAPSSALAATPAMTPFVAPPPPTPVGPPSASLSPTTVSFPDTTINTASETATFTVQNRTGFNAQTAYIHADGGAAQTGVAFNDCTTVMNGRSCNFGLVFAPKNVGLLTGPEWVVLCSGPNGTGMCVTSSTSTLTGTGLNTDGSICPTGSSIGDVDAGTLQIHGCLTTVERTGNVKLYFISGSASALGLHLAPSTDQEHFTVPSFTGCTGACQTALDQFNNGPVAEMVIDPNTKQIATNRKYTINWGLGADATELYNGHLNVVVGSGALLDLPVTPLTKLLGVPFTGRFQVFIGENGGARVHVNVGLPAVLGGLTGETDIGVSATGDVSLTAINITVGDAVIAGLRVRDLAIAWNPSQGYYHGAATLSTPTPKAVAVSMSVTIDNNTLSEFAGGFMGLNLPIAETGIYVQDLGVQVALQPSVVIGGNAAFTAGPMIKVAGTDVAAAKLTGALKIAFPGTQVIDGANVYVPYTRFGATGTLDLLGSQQLATAYLGVQSNGYIEAGGSIERRFGEWGKIKGTLKGEVSGQGFNLEGRASVEVKYKLTLSAHGEAVVSSAGIAGCAQFYWLAGGVGYKWGGSFSAFRGCDLGEYRVAVRPGAARAATAGSTPIRIPAGEPEAGLEIVGTDAPPNVKLIAPDGTVVKTSTGDDTGAINQRFAIVRESDTKTTVIVLRHPVAGAWKLQVLPGSSPISSVNKANGLAPPRASVTVSGHGKFYRTLHWHLKTEPGQIVHFVELGAEDSHMLISTTRASGHLRFAIPNGVAGRREIQAQFQEAGLPRADAIAGSYTAPAAPTPKRPTNVKLTRTGTMVHVTWERRGLIPTSYELHYSLGDGQDTLVFLPGTARSFDITTDLPTDRVSVSVAELDSNDVLGPDARRTLARGM